MIYKNLKLRTLLLSNIICKKEQKLRNRAKPKYGNAIFLIQSINDATIYPAHKNQTPLQTRALIEVFYLLNIDDSVANELEHLTTGTKKNLLIDPLAISCKENREDIKFGGYRNLKVNIWGNTHNMSVLPVINPMLPLKNLITPDEAIKSLKDKTYYDKGREAHVFKPRAMVTIND